MKTRLRRTAYALVCLFWALEIIELTIVSAVQEGSAAWATMVPRTAVAAFGILVFVCQVEVIVRTLGRAPATRIAAVALSGLAGCASIFIVNLVAFTISFPNQGGADLKDYVYPGFSLSWFCLALLGSILIVSYVLEGRERERRLADTEAAAKEARLAALRYQLNPHFLFNSMNSIASLIHDHLNDEAESMVEALSDFLRITLEIDPVDDIPLGREIELQSLYLSIEQVRFPDRLRTRYEVPRDLERLLVPALILQPLVENAVRHAVANTSELVTIVISARRDGDRLRISVEDDGGTAESPRGGSGIGTANVRARLEGRYGEDQAMETGRTAFGYRSSVAFPAVAA
jgi:two-component sensor histidine kinase/uncharacterized membrane protein YhaH (DUF805 family)